MKQRTYDIINAGPRNRFMVNGRIVSNSSQKPQFHNTVRDAFANPDEVAESNGLDAKKNRSEVHRLSELAVTSAVHVGRMGDPDIMRSLYQTYRKDAQGRSYLSGVINWIARMMRRTITAPSGSLLLNGDWAQIEARIAVWISQQIDMIQAYANGEDVYRKTAAGIYQKSPDQITKTERQAGKVSILACSYGGGAGALVAMGMNYGMLMSEQEGTPIVKGFRESNKAVVAFWYACDDAAAWAVQYPGREFAVPPLGLVSYFMDGDCLCCRLPSTRLLRYWAPRLTQEYWSNGKPKDRLSLSALTVKGRAVFRRSVYHTILVENCLSGVSSIITCHGPKRLLDVTQHDLLWDGSQWVRHNGVVFQGWRNTLDFGGVFMTEDHKVLIDDEWKKSGDSSYDDAARSYAGHYRDPRWLLNRSLCAWLGRAPKSGMESSLRLWRNKRNARRALKAWRSQELRVQEVGGCAASEAEKQNPRHVSAPCLLGVAFNVRSVSAAVASCVGAIWRSRHTSLCVVAGRLFELLEGHGVVVQNWPYVRTERQFERIQPRELRVGDSHNTEQKQARQRCNLDPVRDNDGFGSGEFIQREDEHSFLPSKSGVSNGAPFRSARRHEPVFDILNAGPLHRFTVVGGDGRLIIVSNCCQAIAADMLATALENADTAGIPVGLHVHDNLAAECLEERVADTLPVFEQCMLDMPSWTQGLPINAEVEAVARFG